MWWPQPIWYEAHNAPGDDGDGTRWALAGGFVGGPKQTETYVLIANTAATAGGGACQLYFEDGAGATRDVHAAAESRTNVAISSHVSRGGRGGGSGPGREFGAAPRRSSSSARSTRARRRDVRGGVEPPTRRGVTRGRPISGTRW